MRCQQGALRRRQLLARSGRSAVALGALSLLPRRARAAPADAKSVELVTVTDSSAVLTWESEGDTEARVRYGLAPDQLGQEATDLVGVGRYHRAEITDLEPGSTIFYAVEADGIQAEPNEYSPGSFTTLVPPPGELLFSFATVNDMHVGLTSAGEVSQIDLYDPVECPLVDTTCWAAANEAVVEAINASGAAFTLAKGDLSHEHTQEQLEDARALLEGLSQPYHAVRGNHDRQGEDPEDLFPLVFELDRTHYSFSHEGVRFIVLDSSNLANGWPAISEEQFSFLEAELSALGDERLFVVLHHPVTDESTPVFSLLPPHRPRLHATLAPKVDQLLGILSGHSHRNKITHQPEQLGDTPCVETACTVHYPGGYHLYRVYTGGYMQIYHKVEGTDWRVWEEAGRAMYNAQAQQILLGSAGDRNFVYPYPTAPADEAEAGCECRATSRRRSAGLALASAALLAGGAVMRRRG